MTTEKAIFTRTELLIGPEALERIGSKRVIIVGVGGVGSWCAESLVRSGIRRLTIVDSDSVCASNINRQLMATTQTVGQPKVEVLKERLLSINPSAEVTALQQVFSQATAEEFHLEDYDYIIDAIDSLKDKAWLILMACQTKGRLFSSMGAALKCDPTQVRVSEFWEVDGCPLAATLRRRMRRAGRYPGHKFKCTWSPEVVHPGTPRLAGQPNGSLVQITAIMGFTLAGLIINEISHT